MRAARLKLYDYLRDPDPKDDPYTLLSRTSALLCDVCNTHRLGPTMADATAVLVSLATGKTSGITYRQKIALRKYFQRIGYLVDIQSSDYDLTERQRNKPEFKEVAHLRVNPPVYGSHDRYDWLVRNMASQALCRYPMRLNKSPSRDPSGIDWGEPVVWIGRHRGYLGAIVPVEVSKHFLIIDGLARFSGKRFYYVVGQLAVVVHFGVPLGTVTFPPTLAIPDCYVQLSDDLSSVPWPPKRDVDYWDFFGLFNPTVEPGEISHRLLGEVMLNNPDIRRGQVNHAAERLGIRPGFFE